MAFNIGVLFFPMTNIGVLILRLRRELWFAVKKERFDFTATFIFIELKSLFILLAASKFNPNGTHFI